MWSLWGFVVVSGVLVVSGDFEVSGVCGILVVTMGFMIVISFDYH